VLTDLTFKLGVVLVTLGIMHFTNVAFLLAVRRSMGRVLLAASAGE
jgi:hypothetical protein